MTVGPGWMVIAFLAFLVAQRLSELLIASRNTAALMASGGREVGTGHYPVMVAMHATWLGAIVIWGWDNTLHPGWFAVYAVLQVFRVWILATLGRRWTTRIILHGSPLVTTGPFRYMRHPNYVLVVAEIFVTPMVLGLWPVAVVWTMLNAAMLRHRIGVEETALAPQR